MKFLIDAHLPPSLKAVFQAAGHDALHTMDLPDQNASRDGVLNSVSMAEQRVVVTKDTDFYYSHLLHGRPWKLVLVRTGNMGLRATKLMFETHLPAIEPALQSCTLVELDQQSVSIIAWITTECRMLQNRPTHLLASVDKGEISVADVKARGTELLAAEIAALAPARA